MAQYYKSQIYSLYSNTSSSLLRPLIQIRKNSLKTPITEKKKEETSAGTTEEGSLS